MKVLIKRFLKEEKLLRKEIQFIIKLKKDLQNIEVRFL